MKVIQVCLGSTSTWNGLVFASFFENWKLTAAFDGSWQDYLDQHKLRLWDFFRNIDKDGTMRVPVSDFRRAVQVSELIFF